MFGVYSFVRQSSQHPQDPLPRPHKEKGHASSLPLERNPKDALSLRGSADPGLDSLLGRVEPTLLGPGFAERVIQSVQPTEAGSVSTGSSAPRVVNSFRVLGLAASVACCFCLAWWSVSPPDTRTGFVAHRASTTPSEEELLLKALATLEINSGDLALVAQLGDVLEAELTEPTSWLEKE